MDDNVVSSAVITIPPDVLKRIKENSPAILVAQPEDPETRPVVPENAMSVTPPSSFIPYKTKYLYVKPIKGLHQAKFSAASKTQSFKVLSDTIGSLIEGVPVEELTIPDFNWLLYYLRQTNYVKRKFQHLAYCQDDKHLTDVIENRKDKSTLENLVILEASTLEETPFDDRRLAEFLETEEGASLAQAVSLGHPRIKDVIALQDTEQSTDPEQAELFDWLSNRAMLLDGGSIADRMKIVEDMIPAHIEALEKYMMIVMEYGTKELVTTKCKECGSEIVSKVTISAETFL